MDDLFFIIVALIAVFLLIILAMVRKSDHLYVKNDKLEGLIKTLTAKNVELSKEVASLNTVIRKLKNSNLTIPEPDQKTIDSTRASLKKSVILSNTDLLPFDIASSPIDLSGLTASREPLKQNNVVREPSLKKKSLVPTNTFNVPYIMVFDCETTGIPGSGKVIRIVQLSWIVLDAEMNEIKRESYYLDPKKPIPEDATAVHGITDDMVQRLGAPHFDVFTLFWSDLDSVVRVVSHNYHFDSGRVELETGKAKIDRHFIKDTAKPYCTMLGTMNILKLYPKYYGEYKYPNLAELAEFCGVGTGRLHNSMEDALVTAKCLKHLLLCDYIKMKGTDVRNDRYNILSE